MLDDHRLTHCSSCGAQIPESLRYTSEQIAMFAEFEAEFERLAKLDKEWRDYFSRFGRPLPGVADRGGLEEI
jgi:hypothetical protein